MQPRLSVVPGVASSDILGDRTFAMRVWLDPTKLAQFGLSTSEVVAAMRANNYSAAAGATKGYFDVITNRALTNLTSADEFRQLVVKNNGTELVRLGDVADIQLGAQSADSSVVVDGNEAVFIGIQVASDANSIDVVKAVRDELPNIQRDLPEGLNSKVVYDSTTFINSSIEEVVKTVGEAALIVIVVIFLFLGSFRSVAIPIVTIPLSLVGVGTALFALGFSINLMTLLAMVLAIGLVVDDAIVVVENIHRHIEEGLTPFQAAIKGTREISTPVISMTITLAAVYTPIALMGGLTGALFSEFALTLAGSVVVSGIIALTLSPMMSSRILKHTEGRGGFAGWLDRRFDSVQRRYGKMLKGSLNDRFTTVIFAILVVASLVWLFPQIRQELAPEEDQGALLTMFDGPSKANIDYMSHYASDVRDAFGSVPEAETVFTISGFQNTTSKGLGIGVLKPWDERDRSARAISGDIQGELNKIPGVKGSVFSPPALPSSGGGYPVSFVIQTTADYKQLNQVANEMVEAAQKSGRFLFVQSDLNYDSPQTVIHIDREKAASLGVTMQSVASTLANMAGGNYVNLINIGGRAYQVIPEAPRAERLTPEDLGRYYVPSAAGSMVPLSSLITLEQEVVPQSLNRFNQLNSATISGVPMIGLTTGDALSFLQEQAQSMPAGFTVDYSGQSRQQIEEGNALYLTFGFAIIIIYLVLAAQYESLRDPLVILVSVPLSIVGALIPLAMGFSTLNIYSQIGLVTLIGLITKHGILICEVAREQQEEFGKSRAEAVEIAAEMRLRPILMTTAAMVAGLVPMLLASGAGAASRMSISLVIVAGMSIGTLFTLFVLPVIYTFLASDRSGIRERRQREEEAISAIEAKEGTPQAG